MFIHSLELSNIRSYEFQKLSFSKGITLLSGDIGSGKSTVLIGLEFALFGILRGKTSPSELLRHGAKDGYVKLHCRIQNDEIIIKRSLKRSGSSIAQKDGSISINGSIEELTPVELKARVLTLLGYPESLLNKSTNLFRYTVYTPQEQVKLILHESPEERKDIIRKIFDIDKYKRVSENTSFYSSDLRERIQRLKGQTDDIKTLQEQLDAQKNELERLNSQLPLVQKDFESATQNYNLLEEKRLKLQKEIDAQKKIQHAISLLEQSISSDNRSHKTLQQDIIRKEESLLNLTKNIKELSFDPEKKTKILSALKKLQETRSKANEHMGVYKAKREQANNLSSSVLSLDNCPTCKQEVSSSHKEHIVAEQKVLLEKIQEKEKKVIALLEQVSLKESQFKKQQEELQKVEREFMLSQQKQKQLEQLKKEMLVLKEREEKLLLIIKEKEHNLLKEKENLPKEILKLDSSFEKEILDARSAQRKAELDLNGIKTKQSVATKMHEQLVVALNDKSKISKRIDELSLTKQWLADLFLPLIKTVEKRVLLKVYHEFNNYFVEWFLLLIDDDSFTVRLNEDFSPLIEQNGFDTNVANLSGGEKTALALAYRLALNKVLNNYFGSLHTKDLLILDEPTDGFSTEQIDRLREVLIQLGLTQLLIVSHEQKLESLSDNIIRIQKNNQASVFSE